MRPWTGSGNGLCPARRQAIAWTSVGLLSIGLLRTNCSENRLWILSFSFMKIRLKFSPAKVVAILFRGWWVNYWEPGVTYNCRLFVIIISCSGFTEMSCARNLFGIYNSLSPHNFMKCNHVAITMIISVAIEIMNRIRNYEVINQNVRDFIPHHTYGMVM